MLYELVDHTCDRLARRLQIAGTPGAECDNPTPVTTSEQKAAERLKLLLTPNHPVQEIAGLSRQPARLLESLRGLRTVKAQGFRVVVYNRRRLPRRPALEERRDEPVLLEGRPTCLPAGFLLPPVTHQTLWTYLLVRRDQGQSTAWN